MSLLKEIYDNAPGKALDVTDGPEKFDLILMFDNDYKVRDYRFWRFKYGPEGEILQGFFTDIGSDPTEPSGWVIAGIEASASKGSVEGFDEITIGRSFITCYSLHPSSDKQGKLKFLSK